MRYLTLAEALIIAEAVTGLEATTLARASRLELLDSALHAPEAGFGEVEFYPDPIDKAAVLAVRIARNHPLPGWQQETRLAGPHPVSRLEWVELKVPTGDAVSAVLAVAAGELNEEALAAWLRERAERLET